MSTIPHTMRHARRGARWAIARFDDGSFALYWRDVNGVWRSRTAPPVRIYLATIHPVWQ